MTRGVIYMVWGDNERVHAALPRAVASLKKHHPEFRPVVLRMPDDSDLRCKSRMFELSPFDQTLYLDADTLVLGRLDYGFEKAAKHGLAITINVSPWARRYTALRDRGDICEFDTGVIFFSKAHAPTARVFEAWQAAGNLDSSSQFVSADGVRRMTVNDQCGFAAAVDACDFNPWILPVNWNLHPRWQKTLFGALKVWHDYGNPPPKIDKWNREQNDPDAVNVCGQIE